jgi:hypothetical protein
MVQGRVKIRRNIIGSPLFFGKRVARTDYKEIAYVAHNGRRVMMTKQVALSAPHNQERHILRIVLPA